jgi:pantoate--beta-alanine ligase
VGELRAAVAEARAGMPADSDVGLVPTMGAFHDGHGSLMRGARAECGTVVVTVFVNPSQFGPSEDLASYPRDLEADLAFAEREGVDILFAPSEAQVYPRGFDTWVEVGGLTSVLDGHPAHRGPGHFRGVATVVLKLLNMAQPDVAYFGQKDLQQALVLSKLVRDLDIPVALRIMPTIREADGLAMSSRNGYLSAPERERALALSRALRAAGERVRSGRRDAAGVVAAAQSELDRAGLRPEYLELRRTTDLSTADAAHDGTFLALAVRVGPARLIDNIVFGPLDPLGVPPGATASLEEVPA